MDTVDSNMEATYEVTFEATQENTTMRTTQEATEESKGTIVVFKQDEMKFVELLKDNELLYNKRLMDYKDPNKGEALWDKFGAENKIDKAAYNR